MHQLVVQLIMLKSAKEANDTMQDGDILVVKTLDREYIDILDRVSGIIVEEDAVSFKCCY